MKLVKGRRNFMKYSSMAMAAMLLPDADILAFTKKYSPKLSFSTLGCPDWPLETIVHYARKNKYQGVEIRTIQGELDLPKCPVFSAANIAATKRMFADNHLIITDLGASTALHHTDIAIRNKNLDEAKRFIDLAAKLDSPYIRVFPDKLPANTDPKPTLDIIKKALMELVEYSKGSQVKVLMETHGDVVKADDLHYVMQDFDESETGLIWDFFNMWIVTKQSPTEVYHKLKNYIRHVHVKDGLVVEGKLNYCLLGKGEAPIKEVMQLLKQNNYQGFCSFEWEKMWHKEIEEPEITIPHYAKTIKMFFN